MNYFVEGLQGSGKSTLISRFSERHPDCLPVREGEYSPVELAWCAWLEETEYQYILDKFGSLRPQIEEKTYRENGHVIVCYTKIMTENREFYQELEKHEIYNNRTPYDVFKQIILDRFRKWNGDKMIFECSLFQNIVEDLLLFRNASDEEILAFYREIREALEGKEYRILYLNTRDIAGNLQVIRKERSDEKGNELWFPMMLGFFNNCPASAAQGLFGEKALMDHFAHRQELELRICREVFPDRYIILNSKEYQDGDLI
jgi:hypothetical protein